MDKKKEKTVEIKYKIRMIVDIEGCIEDTTTLRDDVGIEPFLQWAADDIEKRLECVCDIVGVKKIELEEV